MVSRPRYCLKLFDSILVLEAAVMEGLPNFGPMPTLFNVLRDILM